jgi:hypothetical protein
VLARPSAAQWSSSWGNAAAPRGPRRAASVGRRMGSGASPHSPLRQPRRHGCCPCRAPLLGYPAAAGPSCRGRLPAPRGALPLLRRLLRVREPVSGCCCRDLERLLVGRHRCWASGQLALVRFVDQLAPRLAWRPCASATPLRLTARAPYVKARGPQPAPGTPAPNPNCLARI